MKNMKFNEPVLEEVKEADHALLEESLKKAQELSEKQQVEKDLFKDFQRNVEETADEDARAQDFSSFNLKIQTKAQKL